MHREFIFLKDGIYYLGVYETEDKEVSRIKEEEPEQGVLKEGMVSVTDTTPVITDEEKEIILQEGTYYFSYGPGEKRRVNNREMENILPTHGCIREKMCLSGSM